MQLNFAKYRRGGQYSYKMLEPGRVQIPGFTDSDVYADVVAKGAKGLGIEDPTDNLRLIVSSGLVMDSPLSSGPWESMWLSLVILKSGHARLAYAFQIVNMMMKRV